MRRLLPLLALLAPAAALAQPADAADEEAAVLAVVNELWDAMRAGDSTRVRAVLHPEARGYSVGVRDGQVVLWQEETLDEFVAAVGTPHDEVWDERVSGEEVRLDGPLATYYAAYEFWLGERRSHCGVDAFQLVKTDDAGWQIFVLSDTRRLCE
ncbi:MAG TPA: nuclear transport factor 2 family protein [Rubricoccaceae bacterium]|nr:nuclear transport factor 2 family protein [Rubricoccaceae bacterium]